MTIFSVTNASFVQSLKPLLGWEFAYVCQHKHTHPKNLFYGYLNVNSIRNKITFDIFLISETKIDDSFPSAQFQIEGYKSFRKDRDAFGGGLLFYVNEKLNCRSLEICLIRLLGFYH